MGLDICAFSNAIQVSELELENPNSDESVIMSYTQPSFPFHSGNVIDEACYKYNDSFYFRAGSYSSYGQWRDTLWEPSFTKLIHFSDCEGIIGTEYSKELFIEFSTQRELYAANNNDHYLNIYDNFMTAFKLASNNGFVKFS